MKKISVITLFFLFSIINSLIAQDYIGVDNFGCLKLDSNNIFTFHYFDCGIDSGRYERRGDTVILNSIIPSIQIHPMDCKKNDTIYDKNSLCPFFVYNSNNESIKTLSVWIDSSNNYRIYINATNIEKGQLVELNLILHYRLFWPSDTIKCCYLDKDERWGRRIYFENFPVLIKKNKLIPIDEEQNARFYRINRFYFPKMRLGRGKKKYSLYLSGYGPIY